MAKKLPEHPGYRYGKLTIIRLWKEIYDKKRNSKATKCEYVCDCGTKKIVWLSLLRNKNVKSCGCLKPSVDYKKNNKYGLLTIVETWTDIIGNKTKPGKQTICKCLCDCGNYVTTPAHQLRTGHKKSCGCLENPSKNRHPCWNGYGEISGVFWSDIKRGRIRGKKRNRILDFTISIEEAWNLFLKQNRKCTLSGIELKFPDKSLHHKSDWNTASLDRIDSSKGYTLDNCQWVALKVNIMKWSLPQEEFLKWVKLIAKNTEQNYTNIEYVI